MRWIKTYESLLEWEWFTDGNMLKLWTYLLLSANYRDKRWHGIEVKRGQLVTTLASLSEKTNISVRGVRTCLDRLKDSNEITEKTTNKYRIITICKYESYQSAENENDKQTTNKRQTNDKQTTTTLEYIEEIDNKESISLTKVSVSFPQKVLEFFNSKMEGNVIPKIRGISGKRLKAVQARLREHGEEAVFEMIRKASESDFLNGKNNRGWTATFDWLFLPSNFQKVLEDNYRNNETNSTNNEREQRAAAYAATIANLAAQDDARKGDVW